MSKLKMISPRQEFFVPLTSPPQSVMRALDMASDSAAAIARPPSTASPAVHSLASALLSVIIFASAFLLLKSAKITQVYDSKYCLLVSEALVRHGRFTLDTFDLPNRDPTFSAGIQASGYPYQLEVVDDHVYYYFPPGSSVLSLPFVILARPLGYSVVDGKGEYDLKREIRLQRRLAAILTATFACIAFWTCRLFLPASLSIITTAAATFGTQVQSTAACGLWSHTWGLVLLSAVVLMLLSSARTQQRPQPVLLASLLSWLYFIRPTNAVSVIAVSAYVLLLYRGCFLPYALTGAAWACGFLVYSLLHFGRPLPSYYLTSRLTWDHLGTALLGNLISPGRGFFVYVPSALFVLYLSLKYRRRIPYPALASLALSVAVAHVIVISGYPHWWGGHSYGPRLCTEIIPWFLGLAVLSLYAAGTASLSRIEKTLGILFVALSVAIHTHGARSKATAEWNSKPADVDTHPERLWDWRAPQFLAGLHNEVSDAAR